MKSQRTVLVGYLTITTVLTAIKYVCRQQYYLPFSNTAHARNSCCAKLSISFLLSYDSNRPELNQLITDFRESTAAWIWVGSQQNWWIQTEENAKLRADVSIILSVVWCVRSLTSRTTASTFVWRRTREAETSGLSSSTVSSNCWPSHVHRRDMAVFITVEFHISDFVIKYMIAINYIKVIYCCYLVFTQLVRQ